MRKISFCVGKNKKSVKGLLHDEYNKYFDSVDKHPAIVIVPGGGYNHNSLRESELVALKFLSQGYNCFILSYSVNDEIKTEVPLLELAEAIDVIKKRSDEFQIDINKIAVLGFSAGGHLAACLQTMYKSDICSSYDCLVSRFILVYPVIIAGEFSHKGSFEKITLSGYSSEFYSLEKRVDKDTLPCLIFHSADDETVPVENSILYMKALSKHKIPFEAHIYPTGGHGWSICANVTNSYIPYNQDWISITLKYLKRFFDHEE